MRLNNVDYIINRANILVERFGTRNPERLAKYLGLVIMERPFKKQKGAYKYMKRTGYIFLKENLPEPMRSIVLLHEIGHHLLHRKQAEVFQEFNLFDMAREPMEYEANLFASQVMLPDEDVVKFIFQGYTAGEIAESMNSDINLVAMKVADLSRRGYAFRVPDHKRNFLKQG